MSEAYPFPVPKAIENDLLKAVAQAGPPWQGLDDWSQSEDDPALFGFFNCWRGLTSELLDALKLIFKKIEAHGFENDQERGELEAVDGVMSALETRFVQFKGLLEWARMTWRHDPNVSTALKSQETAGGES